MLARVQVGESDSDEEGDTPEEAQRIQAAAESMHAGQAHTDVDHPGAFVDARSDQTADIQVGQLYMAWD